MLLDVKLAHRALSVLGQPVAHALPVEVMEAHQKGLLFVLLDIALTNDAAAGLARVLGARKDSHFFRSETLFGLLGILTVGLGLVEVEDSSSRLVVHPHGLVQVRIEGLPHLL